MNGLVTQRALLRGDKVGTFTLGPVQVTIGGAKRSTAPVRVRVVERGRETRSSAREDRRSIRSARRRSIRSRACSLSATTIAGPTRPLQRRPELAIDSAALRARSSCHRRQDARRRRRANHARGVPLRGPVCATGRPPDVHERTPRVREALAAPGRDARVRVGTAMVGGKPWNVKLIQNALFPLKQGGSGSRPCRSR